MICSGVNPFLAIYPPFYEIISGIVQGGHVSHAAGVNDAKIDDSINILKTNPIIKRLTDTDYREGAFKDYVSGEYGLILSDIREIKKLLLGKLGKGVYDWFFQKVKIDGIIKLYAEDKYKKEYVTNVLNRIDSLEAQKAKAYLKDLIKKGK